MALVALKCPYCGGEVQLEESMKSGFCIHCGTKIMNEQKVSGSVTIDKTPEVINHLKVAVEKLSIRDWESASKIVDNIMLMDSDCKDAWYMKVLLRHRISAYSDAKERMRGKELKNFGVFSEGDIKKYWGEYDIRVSFPQKRDRHLLRGVNVTIDGKEMANIGAGESMIFGVSSGRHDVSAQIVGAEYGPGSSFGISFTANKEHEFEIKCGSFILTNGKIVQNR